MKLLVGHLSWHSSQILYLAYSIYFANLLENPKLANFALYDLPTCQLKKCLQWMFKHIFPWLKYVCQMCNYCLTLQKCWQNGFVLCFCTLGPWQQTIRLLKSARTEITSLFTVWNRYMEVTWTAVLVTGLTSTDRYVVCLSLTR